MNILAGGKSKFGLWLCALLWSAGLSFAADPAVLAKAVFAPGDPGKTILTIRERGYYSLRAKSRTGTAIEIVDRMAGVIGAISGAPGERDGRIDLLLDPGEYRVNVHPDRNAGLPANLEVFPFREVNPGASLAELPILEDQASLAATLGDRETRSWWIYLPERAELRVEAAGRTLSSCALWQNGQWLMPSRTTRTVLEPTRGRPLLSIEYHEVLEPGHYLLVCAGGEPRVWAEDDASRPFYIRRGFRFLGANGTQRLTISPFGRDAFLLAGGANYVECARDTREQTRVAVGGFSEGRSRYATATSASITKDSKEPWCSLSAGYGNRQWLVLEARPGDELEVSFFRSATGTSFPVKKAAASYWVSTIASQAGRDLIDLTPIAYHRKDKRVLLLKDGAVRLGPREPLVRRVNLLGSATLYVSVEERGAYRIAESLSAEKTGAAGRYRFIPLEDRFLGSPKTPDYQTPDKPFELVKGHYLLDIQPVSAGILHFACYRDGAQRPAELLKRDPPPAVHSITWPSVTVPAGESASLSVNGYRNANMGLVIRELPLSLAEPLSLYLKPGESVEIPITVAGESVITLEGGSGILTDGGRKLNNDSLLGPGRRTLALKNQGTGLELFTLYTTDRRSREKIPVPALKPLEESFPVFTADTPYFADFERGQTRQLLLRVRKPALYRIETQGRLALSLAVRTPLVPSLFSAAQNGVGRNALVAGYLRPGDYLIAVSALDRSRGRAGVVLKTAPLAEEGLLPADSLSRRTVPADIGLKYRLAVKSRGTYAVNSLGLGVSFPFRLEDDEGFPLTAAGETGATVELDPGDYAYYSLPLPFVTRRLTRFSPVKDNSPAPAGKRTALEINSTVQNIWRETPDRAPDVYVFTLPAPLVITLTLSAGMEGSLTGKGLPEAARLAGGRELNLDLPAGDYEFAVRAQETQNLFSYSVGLSTGMLAAGLRYPVPESGGEWVVSTAEERVYDLWTFGTNDLKASLWDAAGTRLIAENDDMENDWNCRITQRLPAGRYRLRLEPAGHVSGFALLSMDANAEEAMPELPLPFVVERTLGREILRYPLRPSSEGLLLVRSEAGPAVKIGLYRGGDLVAEGENFLAVPLVHNGGYMLHLFQRDESPQRVKVSVSLNAPAETSLPARAGVIDLPPLLALRNPAGLSFRFDDPDGTILFSPAPDQACLPAAGRWLTLRGERGFLVMKNLAARRGVRVETLALAPDRPEAVFLAAAAHSFLCETGRDELVLVTAETQSAAPGLSLSPRNAFDPGVFDFRGRDGHNARASLVGPGGSFQGKVWSASADPGGSSAERAELLLRSFPAARDSLKSGDNRTFALPPGAGLRLELPSGDQTLRVLLARGCAATLWINDRPAGAAVAPDDANREVRFPAAGGTLCVVNPGGAQALVTASVTAAAGPAVTALDPAGYEAVFTEAGILRLRVPAAALPAGKPKAVLCVAGAGFHARLLSARGPVHEAAGNPAADDLIARFPAEAGDLEIVHDRGFAIIFFAEPGREADAFAARTPGLRAAPVGASVTLAGAALLRSFSLPADGFIAISVDAPGLVALSGGGRTLAVSAGTDATVRRIVRRLPKGAYEIFSRPLAGAPQHGSLSFSPLATVDLAAVGLDREYFIGRDETHVYSFPVTAPGTVGVGLAVEEDDLRAALLDASSRPLGEGALLIRPLEPGTYYYVVSGAARPVRYSLRLFGNRGNDSGVPKEIADQYQPKEGEE